jgi:hypothetical protein
MMTLAELRNAKPGDIPEAELAALAASLVGQTGEYSKGVAGAKGTDTCTVIAAGALGTELHVTLRRPSGQIFNLRML